MNATTATTLAPAGTQGQAVPIGGPASGSATATQALPLAGSGAGTVPTAELRLPGTAWTDRPGGAVTVPLDAFAKRAGPDVAVATDAGPVRVHAVFQMDPTTKEMSVSVVDEAGRLIRMIPPDSVAKMIAAMAAYRGR
jgi:hypothetical protein